MNLSFKEIKISFKFGNVEDTINAYYTLEYDGDSIKIEHFETKVVVFHGNIRMCEKLMTSEKGDVLTTGYNHLLEVIKVLNSKLKLK